MAAAKFVVGSEVELLGLMKENDVFIKPSIPISNYYGMADAKA